MTLTRRLAGSCLFSDMVVVLVVLEKETIDANEANYKRNQAAVVAIHCGEAISISIWPHIQQSSTNCGFTARNPTPPQREEMVADGQSAGGVA